MLFHGGHFKNLTLNSFEFHMFREIVDTRGDPLDRYSFIYGLCTPVIILILQVPLTRPDVQVLRLLEKPH